MGTRRLTFPNCPCVWFTLVMMMGMAGCNAFGPGDDGTGDNGTQFSQTKCTVSQYDETYRFGFNLPSGAEIVRTKNEADSLTNSAWAATILNTPVQVSVRVEPSSASLQDAVRSLNDRAVARGAELMTEQDAVLSNGAAGVLSVLRFDGLSTFRVQTQSSSRLYELEAVIDSTSQTAELNSSISDLVLSLCVDEESSE